MECGFYTEDGTQDFCSSTNRRLPVLQRGVSEKVLGRIGSLEWLRYGEDTLHWQWGRSTSGRRTEKKGRSNSSVVSQTLC